MWKDERKASVNKLEFVYGSNSIYLTPHNKHIELVKRYKKRGYHVIVWSNNGFAWAKEAVEKLGLTESVDLIMSKPLKRIDDKENDIGVRLYLEE